MASARMTSLYSSTKVSTGWRSMGGCSMVDRSRMPLMAMFRVRGMGVAERVSISTPMKFSFSFSLCFTPNRCSSSMMTRPRSWKRTSLESRRWVPTTMSTLPDCRPRRVSFCCFAVRKRESIPIFTGKASIRESRVL